MNKIEIYKKYAPLIKESMRIYFRADINNFDFDIKEECIEIVRTSETRSQIIKSIRNRKCRQSNR